MSGTVPFGRLSRPDISIGNLYHRSGDAIDSWWEHSNLNVPTGVISPLWRELITAYQLEISGLDNQPQSTTLFLCAFMYSTTTFVLSGACKDKYSGTCLRWSLCKAATSLKQPASLAPDSTKALESISVEQPPLYNGQLELAHRRLSFTVSPDV